MAESEPIVVEPNQDYLGLVCSNCHELFPIVGPLDLVKMPPGQPMTIGSRGPLHAQCPHCQHAADYPVDQVKRFHKA